MTLGHAFCSLIILPRWSGEAKWNWAEVRESGSDQAPWQPVWPEQWVGRWVLPWPALYSCWSLRGGSAVCSTNLDVLCEGGEGIWPSPFGYFVESTLGYWDTGILGMLLWFIQSLYNWSQSFFCIVSSQSDLLLPVVFLIVKDRISQLSQGMLGIPHDYISANWRRCGPVGVIQPDISGGKGWNTLFRFVLTITSRLWTRGQYRQMKASSSTGQLESPLDIRLKVVKEEGPGVELLLFHIKSQLRFWACPIERRPIGDPEHTGEIMSFGWFGDTLESSLKSSRRWVGRRRLGRSEPLSFNLITHPS